MHNYNYTQTCAHTDTVDSAQLMSEIIRERFRSSSSYVVVCLVESMLSCGTLELVTNL